MPARSSMLAFALLLSLCFTAITTASPVDFNKLNDDGHHVKRQSSTTLAPVRGAPLSSMLTSSRLAPIRLPPTTTSKLAPVRPSSSTLAPVRPTTSSTLAPVRPSTTSTRSSSSTRRTSTTSAIGTATRVSSSTTRSSTSSSTAPSSTSPANSAFASNILQAHNAARSTHGGAALTWSSSAEALAKSWAEKCVWQHGGASGLGQNLAASAGYRQTGQQVVAAWMSEESDYDPANPTYSHFTQVVWKATTQVGCYQATCTKLVNPDGSETFPGYSPSYYTVCNYSPPGNVAGQYAQNVQKNA